MVTKVNNLTRKSFKDYSGPINNEEFKSKNILFGYNGRGKSSLALGIIKEFLKDNTKNEENYRFFNRDYIKDNLLLKDDNNSKLKGVIANFGRKDVEAEKEIGILQKQLLNTKELENKIKELTKETREEINKIHENKKGKTSIQKKSPDKPINEIILLYDNDVLTAKKIEKSEEELKKISGDNSLDKEKEKIDTLNISEITQLNDINISEIKEILNTTFNDVEIPTSEIIIWLNEGLTIHKDDENCKFCGNKLNLDEIKMRVDQYNSNKKQKATIELNDFKNSLLKIKSEIDLLIKSKDNIISNLGTEVIILFDTITKANDNIDLYISKIQNKIYNINNHIECDMEDLKEIINNVRKCVENIKTIKNNKSKTLGDKILKLAVLVRGAIGLEIKQSTLITNNIKLIEKKEAELVAIKKSNDEKIKEMEDLKRSKSNKSDFANHISLILSMIEVNLELNLYEDYYLIKHPISNEILTLEDISEGEQNLLALLYFYYELFNDNEQKEFKPTIDLILIDDPISSVDDINKMYVLELIKTILGITLPQVFIFTHVWEDFCNICYGRKDETKYRFYEIKKDTNSYVSLVKTNETPYKHGFKEIYEFSKKPNCADLDDCEIYHYPNVMRKVLEEFLSFKIKDSNPTVSNFNNIIRVLCGDNYSNKDSLKLGMLLNVCNILSHKASRNPDEILKSAKFLMGKIKNIDLQHYNTMKM